MKYLLDTDSLIFLKRGKGNVQQRAALAGLDNCAISEISLAELYVGVFKSNREASEKIVDELWQLFKVLPISGAIKTFALLRSDLESSGVRLEDMDLLIAATAIAGDYTLVTHNFRHFSRIPGLKIEDWM